MSTDRENPGPVCNEGLVRRNKPIASRLRQQKLPAWQPILTATTVIPTIFIVGIVFIPIGVLLIMASNSVKEWSHYYENYGRNVLLNFSLTEDYEGDVFFYYGLDNFFQNHRRYMKSRNDRQLLGYLNDTDGCDPYHIDTNSGKPIAPCGAIANSMFNDSFILLYEGAVVPWTHEGLVWDIDRKVKFRNPKDSLHPEKSLCELFKNTEKPPNWHKRPCEFDPDNPDNNGFQYADFIIWMRTAAFPDFRKPYRRLNRSVLGFHNGLPAGGYTLNITNIYPVTQFSGRKSFIISTTSWAGGKNSFLGFAYVIVGAICIALAVVFFGIHKKYGHLLSEMTVPLC